MTSKFIKALFTLILLRILSFQEKYLSQFEIIDVQHH